jgi:hypothetical protein
VYAADHEQHDQVVVNEASSSLLGIRHVCGSPSRNPPTPIPAFLIPISFCISRTTAPSDGVGRRVLDHEVASVQAMISKIDECLGSMLDARKVDEGESSFRHRRTWRIYTRGGKKNGEIEASRLCQ